MWHDPPPPGTESISLPGGAAKRQGLGDGVSKVGGGGGVTGWDRRGLGRRQEGFHGRVGGCGGRQD